MYRTQRSIAALIGVLAFSFWTSESWAQRPQNKTSKFAEDVLLHVVLHEMGHGLIREFDLPVLGNEETMADAFATFYVTHYLPERALDVLAARISSLMIEAEEIPRDEWSVAGEHNSDARRAHQIAALAVAANPERYTALAIQLGMTEAEINQARDYGSEIHRSWRRILGPLLMPEGQRSSEAQLRFDPSSELVAQLRSGHLVDNIEEALHRFDWHSQVTIAFVEGDGGAAWSRSRRTITVYTEYIERFVRQGAENALESSQDASESGNH